MVTIREIVLEWEFENLRTSHEATEHGGSKNEYVWTMMSPRLDCLDGNARSDMKHRKVTLKLEFGCRILDHSLTN